MPHASIQYSKSNRARCSVCRNKIAKGLIRIGYHYCNNTDWHHLECFILSDKPFDYQNGIGYTFDELWNGIDVKSEDEEEVENVLDKYRSNKANLKLSTHVFEMNVKELKQELKIRHLRTVGNKPILQQRIKNWFQNEWCLEQQKRDNDKLVGGLCRNFQKENNIKIPVVLETLIKSFVPTFVI
eukprot:81788_1